MSSPNDIPCRDIVELVTEYLEGALPPDERARVEEHFVVCPPCMRYLRQMEETARLLGTRRASPTAEDKEKLLSIFRSWKARGGGS